MNKTEAAYDRQLREQWKAGLIQWWEYEPIKIRLADSTYYTPDFVVVAADGHLEAHEVKAYWQASDWGGMGRVGWREDARIKIKVAAESFPIRFRAAVFRQNGAWEYENFFDEDKLSPYTEKSPTKDAKEEKDDEEGTV